MNTRAFKYRLFSPGELKPSGWLRKQLRIQADGLSGNLDKFWPSIRDSAWIGGPDDGWERVPYWLDGFIPLAYLLDDNDMIARARTYVDGILARQCEDGWICPCAPEQRGDYDLWAVLLITKVLTVYAECSGEKARMEEAIYRVFRQLNGFLGTTTLKQWGQTRWFEGLIAAYWLYERRPEPWILDLCRKLSIHGTDWEKALDSGLLEPASGNWDWFSHVVNLAMALKSDALLSRLNGNDPDAFAERLFKYLLEKHGMACHHFSGDECLHGTSPLAGTELCGVVEAMYSYQILFRIGGNPVWLDRLEELACNALPATVSPDMWTHQYDQMTNQIVCAQMSSRIFRTNGPRSNVFGLEPNYGCCTANFNQGFPKFAWASFLRGDGEIASCTLAPATLATEINGVGVRCELSTDYPFNNVLDYEIETDAPVDFTFSIRIPKCVTSAAVNGEPALPGSMFRIARSWDGRCRVRVELTFETRFESRPSGMSTVWNGPFLFALPIEEKWERVEDGKTLVFPHCDYHVTPQSEWRFGFACDASDMKIGRATPDGKYVFDPGHPPIWLEARMSPISWQSTADACAEKPDSAVPTGPAVVKRLIPYGCTNLRIAETCNLGPDVRDSLRESDFDCRREDGRYVSSLAFAMAQLRRMKPAYSFDDIADASELPVWREKVRAKLKELLQIGDGHVRPFRLVSEQPRDGYRLRRYEFHPEDGLAVQILALVPESAIESGARVPAVICLPGSGASLASLAGEPDAFANHFPLRNRQAWFYAKAGMVAVAMENPATAENGVSGVNHYVAQQQFARLMALVGRSVWGFMVEQVLQTVDFLRRSPHVDPARIAVSGMSLGCIPALYTAVLSDDIAAVVYNDWVGSWALTAMAQTRDVGGAVDARRPFGFYRWFDDEPDLMAAIAPRPMLFAEGGIWKRGIEKVKRAYALAGAGDRLAVRYYAKYADPASRRHDGEDLKEARGLTDAQLMEFANVDAPQHSFHPEINVPWLSEVFFGHAGLPPELDKSIKDSVAAPGAW